MTIGGIVRCRSSGPRRRPDRTSETRSGGPGDSMEERCLAGPWPLLDRSARWASPVALQSALSQLSRKIAARTPCDRLLHGYTQTTGVDAFKPFEAVIQQGPHDRSVANLLTAHNLDTADPTEGADKRVVSASPGTLPSSADDRHPLGSTTSPDRTPVIALHHPSSFGRGREQIYPVSRDEPVEGRRVGRNLGRHRHTSVGRGDCSRESDPFLASSGLTGHSLVDEQPVDAPASGTTI